MNGEVDWKDRFDGPNDSKEVEAECATCSRLNDKDMKICWWCGNLAWEWANIKKKA